MLILSINKLPAHTAKYSMYLKLSDYIKTTITSVEHKPNIINQSFVLAPVVHRSCFCPHVSSVNATAMAIWSRIYIYMIFVFL